MQARLHQKREESVQRLLLKLPTITIAMESFPDSFKGASFATVMVQSIH